LEVKVGKEGGLITISNCLHDKTGGTLLSLGAAGQIDFAGIKIGTLKASSFQIG
jgi:hypothetical protein